MSKKKKSVEELLEEALVPEEEQPYPVPENWVWVRLENFVELERGITFPASAKQLQYEEGLIGCARTANIQENFVWDDLIYVDKQYMKNNPNKLVREKDILMSTANSYHLVGKVNYLEEIKEDITFGGFLLCIRARNVLEKYLYYFLKESFLSGKIQQLSSQTTNIANLSTKKIESIPFVVPPYKEQERIVCKIEHLLRKIDSAKQLIEEAKETFELRRDAILDKAFRGDLSRKWRKDEKDIIKSDIADESFNHINGFYELPPNWHWVTLELVCETITDGDHQAPPKSEEGIPFLVISNMSKGVLDFQKTRYVPEEYYNALQEKRKPKVGDILYSVVGSFGIPVLVDTDKKFCFQRHIAILKPNENIDSKFLYYIMSSKLVYNQASNCATGTAQMTVPLSGLRKIKIPLPPLSEQKYIVSVIERIFNKQALVESSCNTASRNTEVLSQSILSKAFRGELGTNDPTEESALELLKDILQEKAQ